MKIEVKPSDYNIKKHFYDTIWQNNEKETIARNIVSISKNSMNNEFSSFSWKEYIKYCKHKITIGEKYILDDLVDEGYLDFDEEEKYRVNEAFIGVIYKFKKKKN